MTKLPIPFNNPTTYAGHSGIDYPVSRGTPIPASGTGRVTWRGWNSVGGYFIWVKYDALGPEVGYHHMDSHSGCPAEGARVSLGQRLGYCGSSGRSTGPHVHSEVAGNRTTDGYWRFFDRNRVVGSAPAGTGGNSAPTRPDKPAELNREEEDEMTASFINVQGKGGSHRAGTFAIMRDNNGKLFAKRVSDALHPTAPTIDNTELSAWMSTMTFHGI